MPTVLKIQYPNGRGTTSFLRRVQTLHKQMLIKIDINVNKKELINQFNDSSYHDSNAVPRLRLI